MFAFTLVLQLVPLIAEIAAPFAIRFAMRFVSEWQQGKEPLKKLSSASKAKEGRFDQKWIDDVQFEASLPEHDFFSA